MKTSTVACLYALRMLCRDHKDVLQPGTLQRLRRKALQDLTTKRVWISRDSLGESLWLIGLNCPSPHFLSPLVPEQPGQRRQLPLQLWQNLILAIWRCMERNELKIFLVPPTYARRHSRAPACPKLAFLCCKLREAAHKNELSFA